MPLLTLKHDTPLDSRFVRGFFDTYYLAATVTAGATSVGLLLSSRLGLAAGAAALVLVARVLRRTVIPRMEALQAQMPVDGAGAIARFRRIHVAAIAANLAQLALIVGSLIGASMP